MPNRIRGVYFDFGYVIGHPIPNIDRQYLYLDWDGIKGITEDPNISRYLRPGVGPEDLTTLFKEEIYEVFIRHENTDLIDPGMTNLLVQKLTQVFSCRVNEPLINQVLAYVNTMKFIKICPGVPRVLEFLKAHNMRISMISNMMLPGKLLIEKLRENHILRYFDTVTVSSDIGFIKPHQEIFLKTLQRDGLIPEEVLFVGDTYAQDSIGARNAGMVTAWLNRRNEVVQNRDAADFEIFNLEDLIKIWHL